VANYNAPATHFINEYEMVDQTSPMHSHGNSKNREYSKTDNQVRFMDIGNKDHQILSEQHFPSKNSSTKERQNRFLTEELGINNTRNTVHELVFTKEELNGVSDDELRKKIQTMFKKEKPRFSQEIIEQCEDLMDKHGLGHSKKSQGNLLDEFYKFCEETLPYDEKYKESVLFVSMFYYFLERKKLIG
jgi:hypothetical protein